jgi:hypothetical protein
VRDCERSEEREAQRPRRGEGAAGESGALPEGREKGAMRDELRIVLGTSETAGVAAARRGRMAARRRAKRPLRGCGRGFTRLSTGSECARAVRRERRGPNAAPPREARCCAEVSGKRAESPGHCSSPAAGGASAWSGRGWPSSSMGSTGGREKRPAQSGVRWSTVYTCGEPGVLPPPRGGSGCGPPA